MSKRTTFYLILLICTSVFCKNVTDVSYTLDDFTSKNKKIGNLIYTAARQYTTFESTVLTDHHNLLDIRVNGDIYTKVDIDRDEVCSKLVCCKDSICYITLKAYLFKGTPTIFNIKIGIHDANDNKPSFSNTLKVINIPESAELYSTYKLPVATDADSSKFGIDGYTLSDFTNTFITIMENNEPSLKLVKPLDRESLPSYNVKLVAYDKGNPQLSNSIEIKIKISDVNDNSPYFVISQSDFTPLTNFSGSQTIKIKENHSGDIIYQVHAHDLDDGDNAKIYYTISQTQSQPVDIVKQKFSLKSPHETAKIQLRQNLDYENESERHIMLVIVATDNGKPPRSSSISLTIQLLDENDNPPTIEETASKDIKENDPKSQQLKIFSVSDKDSVSQKKVNCLLSDESGSKFELHKYDWNMYDLKNRVAFDFEMKKNEVVRIICTDRGDPELTRSANFNVKIIDENDNSPKWDKQIYEANLQENDSSQRILTTIIATDADSDFYGAISYNISSVNDPNHIKFVRIDHETGVIYANQPVDREVYKELIYHITATDSYGSKGLSSNQPVHYNTTKLVITVLDENDNSPKFIAGIKYFKISENAKVNSVVGQLKFHDPDDSPNNLMTISLMEFNINSHTYQRSKWFEMKYNSTIVVKMSLNREELGNVSITVNVEDHGRPPRTVTEDIIVEILDENDNAPVLVYPKNSTFISTNGVVQSTPVDTKLIQLDASDLDNGINASITYKIISSNFSISNPLKINHKNGEISTNWNNFEQPDIGVYFLRISISDQGSPPQTTFVTLYVNVTNANMTISAEAYMSNIVILILIIVCSLALIVSLIAAIFWVRFRVTGDSSMACQDENMEREHLNKELTANHYSLIALENNFRQSSFENSNLNAYNPYSKRQQNHMLYGKSNVLPNESLNVLDGSRLTSCEDCFNSFGTIPAQMNLYESPDIARFRSPIPNDFNSSLYTNSSNLNSKPLILQSYPVTDYSTISNVHPPNLMGEPNFSDSGKGGSVEDLNYRLPTTPSTFTMTPFNAPVSPLEKMSCQSQQNDVNKNTFYTK